MKSSIVAVVFLILATCGVCANESFPDGYLIGMSVVENNENEDTISLFKIDLDGTVSHFWDHSLLHEDKPAGKDLFAIDVEHDLVYVGSVNKYLMFNIKTGALVDDIRFKQFFWSYDYDSRDKAILGGCTNGPKPWEWCRINTTSHAPQVEFLYKLPYTDNGLSPENYIYYLDQKEQSLWYYVFDRPTFAVGFNYRNGTEIFKSARNPKETEDVCIARDNETKRVFTFVRDYTTQKALGIGELFQSPVSKKILLDFSTGGGYFASYGTCTYDQSSSTMIGLSSDSTDGPPNELVLVNFATMDYKQVFFQGQGFLNENFSSLTKIIFIPNKMH